MDELGATPERHDSTGNGTRIAPLSVRPNGGGEPAGAWSASHSQRPLRLAHTAGSPWSRSTGAPTEERTIIGRGYSGSGAVNADTSRAHAVGRSAVPVGPPQRVRAQRLELGRSTRTSNALAPTTNSQAMARISHVERAGANERQTWTRKPFM